MTSYGEVVVAIVVVTVVVVVVVVQVVTGQVVSSSLTISAAALTAATANFPAASESSFSPNEEVRENIRTADRNISIPVTGLFSRPIILYFIVNTSCLTRSFIVNALKGNAYILPYFS